MKYPRKVYAIQHNITKKIYIGSSRDVENRYMSHMWMLRRNAHSVPDMQNDFNEYGENYSLFILDEEKDITEANKEYQWMKKYNTLVEGVGYNYKDRIAKILANKLPVPLKDGVPTMDLSPEDECEIKDVYREEILELLPMCNNLNVLAKIKHALNNDVNS